MKSYNWIFLFAMCFLACDKDAYDAEMVAEDFCECMKSNNASKEFNKASDICFDKLIAENRYVKLWNVDMRDRELDKKVSNETRDSVKFFFDRFTDYTNDHCCEEVLTCEDSKDSK